MLNFLYRTEDIIIVFVYCHVQSILTAVLRKQESPDDADKPARRESMPKIGPIRRENKLQTS